MAVHSLRDREIKNLPPHKEVYDAHPLKTKQRDGGKPPLMRLSVPSPMEIKMNLRDILSRVFNEGKFYIYNCERWNAYGWRLGQLQYETRLYKDGRVRSQLFTRRGCLAAFQGEGGEDAKIKDLSNVCAVAGVSEADCPG